MNERNYLRLLNALVNKVDKGRSATDIKRYFTVCGFKFKHFPGRHGR